MDWSPQQYLKFAGERTRPARDLLAQVPLAAPRFVYDLGCGPGNSTRLLAQAYPEAVVVGIDNSAAMLEEARRDLPRATFVNADLADWTPDHHADLLFTNATFQWIPDHLAVLERLTATLPAGGVLAIQMPDNLEEPSHRLMWETAADGPWRDKLSKSAAARAALPAPQTYYDRLMPLCSRVDIWHTIYNHPLDGAQGIVEWLKSTGLRPFLAPLNETEQIEFLARYTRRIAEAYPPAADGKVLLGFPRLFVVAVRG